MILLANPEIWLVCGSQHLYGPGPLKQVAADAEQIAAGLAKSDKLPLKTVFKALLTTPDEITRLCLDANSNANCAGLILWMHTFSPSKMWIRGLNILHKPFAHLHTQFNAELPWDSIDMDFMNLNQSAHGDREAGFIHTRMRLARKVVVGHWADPEVHDRLGAWMRAARAWHDWQGGKFCRFGDNMRQVAVTEGDKVAAEMAFGFATNGYGVGDLVAKIDKVADSAVADLAAEYEKTYAVVADLRKGGKRHESLLYGAKLELGMRAFLEAGGFKGFTDTFEDLRGIRQLPGLASQRLMADGYGFAAEGDWKTVALLRAMKVMAAGLPGGASFMEDYTYHLPQGGGQVARRAYARDLPEHRQRQAVARDPSARHRRQGGSGASGVRRRARPGAQRQPHRSRQPLPPDRQRGRRRQTSQAAETAGRARGVGVPARPQDRLRGVDPGRRRASLGLQLRRHGGNAGRLHRDRRHRARADRRRHAAAGVQAGLAQQRSLLSPGEGFPRLTARTGAEGLPCSRN